MFAPEVDMATIDLLTIVNYLSEFRGSEGSLRYHVRGRNSATRHSGHS